MKNNKNNDPLYVDFKGLHIGGFFSVESHEHIIVRYGYISTDFGIAFIGICDGKLASLEFIENIPHWAGIEYIRDDAAVKTLLEQSSIDLLLIGTPFQIEVWKTLASVAYGELISYSKLAALMGRPTATRAVASAIARNKIGYYVPCHRVVRSNGDYGQFRWSVPRKIEMILAESHI